MLKIIGIILGLASIIGMLLGFIPLLGWFNWLNIPVAVVGLIFSVAGKSSSGKILNVVAILFGMMRLLLGGGIF
ncbi:MAG: hypothetical protein U0U67_13535 [Chitinophagales bacterium]